MAAYGWHHLGAHGTARRNIILSHVNITAAKTFDVYNAYGVQFVDSHITTTTSGQKTFTLCEREPHSHQQRARRPGGHRGRADQYEQLAGALQLPAFLTTPDLFGCNPIAIGGGILTNSGSLTLSNSVQDFFVGTNTSQMKVLGNLSLSNQRHQHHCPVSPPRITPVHLFRQPDRQPVARQHTRRFRLHAAIRN